MMAGTIYVNVGTVRHAGVTTVAQYQTVSRKHAGEANARGKREDRLLHQRRDAPLPGERERYGHVRQQPRHLLDVVHTAPVTGRRAPAAGLGDHTAWSTRGWEPRV